MEAAAENGSMPRGTDRREIPQRSTGWAARGADVLERIGATPNSISVASTVVAVVAAVALFATAHVGDGWRIVLLLGVAVGAPLRLLLNMLDGMLAVEKGMKTPVGELYNELPDRISDVVLLAAAGYAAAGLWTWGETDLGVLTGWTAAVLALLTAYVRTLGASTGVGNFFAGPMAKPRRMWVLVIACLASCLEPVLDWSRGIVLLVALAVIALGSLATVVVRLRLVAAALNRQEPAR